MLDKQVIEMIVEGIRDTLYMTLVSTLIGYVIGLPFGVLLHVTSEKGLHPNRLIYRIGDFICNIIRSIPFLILLILLIPFTRLIVGQSYGSTATIVPLVICAAPYILGKLGFLRGRMATCYPGFEDRLEGAEVYDCDVIRDGEIITARAMGAAVDFALELTEALCGEDTAGKIRESILA